MHVQSGAHHAVAADQLLRRRQSDEAVHRRRPSDRHHRLLADRTGHEIGGNGLAEPALDMPGSRSVSYGCRVPPNELRAPSTASPPSSPSQDDRARVTQSPNERRIVGRTIVGVLRVGARRRAHVEGVVLVFDGHDDTMEWADEIAGLLELTILRGGDLERVRHRSTVVSAIGQTARLAIVESPFRPRGRSQIERGERVDLARSESS